MPRDASALRGITFALTSSVSGGKNAASRCPRRARLQKADIRSVRMYRPGLVPPQAVFGPAVFVIQPTT
jgi:hypothetical protein